MKPQVPRSSSSVSSNIFLKRNGRFRQPCCVTAEFRRFRRPSCVTAAAAVHERGRSALRVQPPAEYPCFMETGFYQPTSGCRMRCCITSRVTPTVKTRPSGRQRRLLRPRPESHSVSLTSRKPNCPQTNLASSPTTSHQADSGRTPDGAEGWAPGESPRQHGAPWRARLVGWSLHYVWHAVPRQAVKERAFKMRSAQGSPSS